ncbi:MAG: type I-D CRISPR-associated protein Cas7/Csc2 [Candidatus Parabeggiatoa sp. nov. 2]|nr:MAG: type I-D CRISPR-associated protein Cas7/Csc2 [Gammaproteobacteria bacterium]HEC84452.1 type I-D CRISPR-associated protein Cas7/Csc2 [Thioploca sp.]
MQRFKAFLGDIDKLAAKSAGSDKPEYVHPKLKNLGSVSIVLIREAIAPVVFKNFEQEITDIEIESGGEPHIRAVPNKFKYPERGRGLQILRALKAGGRFPQNKTVLKGGNKPSDVFDLNTFVFGDSVQKPKVLPIKAAVNYSDALSVLPKHQCVEEIDHVRTNEAGTLWDEEKQDNSSNLFKRHFIKPGTLMVQVLSTRNCLLPLIGLDHLLLCLGVAGTYGGQTSITGINIRTHIVGIYGDNFEQAITSPYELVKSYPKDNLCGHVQTLTDDLHKPLSEAHKESMDAKEATAYQQQLIARFEKDYTALKAEYQQAQNKIGAFFDDWFGTPNTQKSRKANKKSKEAESESESVF